MSKETRYKLRPLMRLSTAAGLAFASLPLPAALASGPLTLFKSEAPVRQLVHHERPFMFEDDVLVLHGSGGIHQVSPSSPDHPAKRLDDGAPCDRIASWSSRVLRLRHGELEVMRKPGVWDPADLGPWRDRRVQGLWPRGILQLVGGVVLVEDEPGVLRERGWMAPIRSVSWPLVLLEDGTVVTLGETGDVVARRRVLPRPRRIAGDRWTLTVLDEEGQLHITRHVPGILIVTGRSEESTLGVVEMVPDRRAEDGDVLTLRSDGAVLSVQFFHGEALDTKVGILGWVPEGQALLAPANDARDSYTALVGTRRGEVVALPVSEASDSTQRGRKKRSFGALYREVVQ